MEDGGYKRLKEKHQRLVARVNTYRHVKTLWTIPKEKLSLNYSLSDAYEQANIAALTGHEIHLVARGGGLECVLVKQPATADNL